MKSIRLRLDRGQNDDALGVYLKKRDLILIHGKSLSYAEVSPYEELDASMRPIAQLFADTMMVGAGIAAYKFGCRYTNQKM